MTIGNVVLGFPGETEQTAKETIRFVKELNLDDVGFYVATPYPGTPMYEQVKANGWLRVTDFDKYDTAGPTFETPWLTMEKLAEIRYKAYQQFYLRPGYVFHMMRRGGTYGKSAVKTSGAYLLRALHSGSRSLRAKATAAKTRTIPLKRNVIDVKLMPIGERPKNKPANPSKPKLKATESTIFSTRSSLFLPMKRILTRQ